MLADIDWGFFILAEDSESKEPVGLMYFSYEWSDWRNGIFFWLQTAWAKENDQDIHKAMIARLEEYQKERECCGYRLCSEKVNAEYWKPVIERMEMKESHYYIYHVDTQ